MVGGGGGGVGGGGVLILNVDNIKYLGVTLDYLELYITFGSIENLEMTLAMLIKLRYNTHF